MFQQILNRIFLFRLTCIMKLVHIKTVETGLLGDFVDWVGTTVVGEGDTSQLSVSFTYHSSGPTYETLAQSGF